MSGEFERCKYLIRGSAIVEEFLSMLLIVVPKILKHKVFSGRSTAIGEVA